MWAVAEPAAIETHVACGRTARCRAVPSETTLVASLRNERLASSAISEPRKSPKSVAFGESAEVEALRATTSAPSIKIEALPLGFPFPPGSAKKNRHRFYGFFYPNCIFGLTCLVDLGGRFSPFHVDDVHFRAVLYYSGGSHE